MIRDLRVVVDTNVLVSGLFGIHGSPSFHILQAIRTQKLILVTSPVILEEVGKVINRERIVKLTKMSPAERTDFIDKLIERSDITAGKQLSQIVGRDVTDDKFLACGVEGKAEYIISGDEDLLVLTAFEEIKIITPRGFMEILQKTQ
jgi:putative PIN family toxin of toxin-antitoxin system